jgi:hypothetical protein
VKSEAMRESAAASVAAGGRVPRLREEIFVREVDGEAVVLDRERLAMHSFNPAAACILHAIDGVRSIEEIAGMVVSRFEVDPGRALADTARLVLQLEEIGLVELSAPETP